MITRTYVNKVAIIMLALLAFTVIGRVETNHGTDANPPIQYEATLLPQIDPGTGEITATVPAAINNSRVVIGSTGSGHGFIWGPEEGGKLLLAQFPNDAQEASGVDINNNGDIAGIFRAPGLEYKPEAAFHFSEAGIFTALPSYEPDLEALVSAINDGGKMVGTAEIRPGGFLYGGTTAVYWLDGELYDIGGLGGDVSVASGINNSNVIVGYANTPELTFPQPYRWTEDGGIEPLPQIVEGLDSIANDINDAGIIVGLGTTKFGAGAAAVYWDIDSSVHALPGLYDNATFAEATAINSQGHIVGRELHTLDDNSEARLWIDYAVYHLQDLVIELPDNVWLQGATDINDYGDIIAYGFIQETDDTPASWVAVLLTPLTKEDELFNDRFQKK